MKHWTDIRQWISEEDRLIAAGYDSITAYTAEEGTGKSYTMLARHKLSDKAFFAPGAWSPGWKPDLPTDRVVFSEEDCMRRALELPPGSALQLDEADAHRRGAMTKLRRQFLRFLKERRSLRLRLGIGFPHVSQVDRDILRSRVRYRAHQPHRGLLVVSSRVIVREDVDRLGNPVPIIRWQVRGRFPVPDISGYPIVQAYDQKKHAFTHRDDDLAPVAEPVRRFIDHEAALPVVDKIRALLPPNQVFLDQVLGELKSP